MRKIPTLFVRDPATNLKYVTDEVNPACKWVLDGEGIATRKYDGTCVLLDANGVWYARREIKPGKTAPANFVEVEHDETTGKTVGWVPSQESGFEKYLQEAIGYELHAHDAIDPGTYELVGPKINGNPEGYEVHAIVAHGLDPLPGAPRDFDGLRDFLQPRTLEGIVWHHPDGRMAKLKKRDFPKAS